MKAKKKAEISDGEFNDALKVLIPNTIIESATVTGKMILGD
jgi:hypothetical protein